MMRCSSLGSSSTDDVTEPTTLVPPATFSTINYYCFTIIGYRFYDNETRHILLII